MPTDGARVVVFEPVIKTAVMKNMPAPIYFPYYGIVLDIKATHRTHTICIGVI
tara:strand:+ start:734 stop:892 length:159 start_codon:yes stop_codon:yes gene_type:complete